MPALQVNSEGGTKGSIVMLQEIFGVNEAMRQKAQDFASQGYAILLPDLFWRLKTKLSLQYSERIKSRRYAGTPASYRSAGKIDLGKLAIRKPATLL